MSYKEKLPPMTLHELMEKFHIKKEETIDSYLRDGLLPSPYWDKGNMLFDRGLVLKAIGLEHNPDEPLMIPEEVAEMLGIENKKEISHMARYRNLPYYKFRNAQGASKLYLRSEIEKALEYNKTWGYGFVNFVAKNEALKILFSHVISPEYIKGLKENEKIVLQEILLRRKEIEDIGKELGLTNERTRQIFVLALKKINLRAKYMQTQLQAYDKLESDLSSARQLNSKLLERIQDLEQYVATTVNEKYSKTEIPQDTSILLIPLSTIDLPSRVENLMKNLEIKTIGQLSSYKRSHLLKVQGVGKTSLLYIEELLKKIRIIIKERITQTTWLMQQLETKQQTRDKFPVFKITKISTPTGDIFKTKIGRNLLYTREWVNNFGFQILVIQKLPCFNCGSISRMPEPHKHFIMNGAEFIYKGTCCKCSDTAEYLFK